MAAAARWVVKLEEEGGGEGHDDDGGFVPEARRLREVAVTINRQAKRMRIVSSKRDGDNVASYVAGNVGWGESADVEIEDEAGLAFWVKEWRGYVELSTS